MGWLDQDQVLKKDCAIYKWQNLLVLKLLALDPLCQKKMKKKKKITEPKGIDPKLQMKYETAFLFKKFK